MFANSFRSGSDLLSLYDELEKKEEANDKQLSVHLGIKNIAVAKSNLRTLVLKAMRNFREEHNIGDRIRCSLSEIEFLTNKDKETLSEPVVDIPGDAETLMDDAPKAGDVAEMVKLTKQQYLDFQRF